MVDDKRLLELAKVAVELNRLDAAVARQTNGRQDAESVTRSRWRWWVGGAALAAAAVVAIFFTLPPQLVIREMTVSAREVRGMGSDIEIDLSLSRPAYVRIVFIDERFERWIMPVDEDTDALVKWIEQDVTIRSKACPAPNDSRGPALTIAVMVIASEALEPSTDDLLMAIPDPIVPPGADTPALLDGLRRVCQDVESRFDCTCRFEFVPATTEGR